jgi:hypothetical protein
VSAEPPSDAPALARPRVALGLLALVAALLVGSGAFVEPLGIAGLDEFRNNDWLNCRSFDVLSRRALLHDGEWPLRTHLLGGGFPLALHPSDGTWAPTILPVLLFGDVIGVKLNLLWMLWVGMAGVWSIARRFLSLRPDASLLTAALFGLSSWLPSMWLVGFYNQVFYLLVPAVAALMLDEPKRRGLRLLLSAMLLCFILQQGGHAFSAVVFFLGLLGGAEAAVRSAREGDGALRTWAGPILLFVLADAPLAFARALGSPWPLAAGWGPGLLLLGLVPRLRRFGRALLPAAARGGLLLALACSLGAARLLGLALLEDEARYEHRLQREDALWFPPAGATPPPMWEERFYDSAPEFLRAIWGRVPGSTGYGTSWGREGEPSEREYIWLGLSPPFAVLALLGLLVAARRGRPAELVAGLGLLFTGIAFGPRLPPDLHFLLTWGLPPLAAFAQPVKYWNFFIFLSAVLLAGLAVDATLGRVAASRRAAGRPLALARGLLALALLWPLLQSRAVLGELFLVPRPPPAEEPRYFQVAMVGEGWWVEHGDALVRRMSDQLYLRDYVRPRLATEYRNVRRGVGTIDHYGSLVLPEHAIPAQYVSLQGALYPNPRYRGEGWLAEGTGAVHSVHVGHNRIQAQVTLETPGLLVVNQNYLDGFVSNSGHLEESDGLLALRLPAGEHRVTLSWRPRPVLLGFALSGLSFLAWCVAVAVLSVRGRRQAPLSPAP